MNIVLRDPASLKPHPRNSRLHSDEQITTLGRAILEFGFHQPVVIDETDTILIGHARCQAALNIDLAQIPCIVARGLSAEQKRALIIADNRLHEFGAGWNEDLLDSELRDLMNEGIDLSLTGFELSETFVVQEDAPDEDAVPELAERTTSRPGDVWNLDGHCLACGDAAEPKLAAAMMEFGPKLMVTDPPYGVDYHADWRNAVIRANGTRVSARAIGEVLNDDRADWRDVWKLYTGPVAYIWHAGVKAPTVQRSLEAAGFGIRAQIVWAKSRFTIGRGDYHWQHEPCFYAVRGKSGWHGGSSQSSVWDVQTGRNTTGHSTQKPVECMRRPMLNHTKPGAWVFDPFGGSGTTLIAATTCARLACVIELSPAYVDLSVRRWQNFTGKVATHWEDGRAFEEIELERAA